MKFYVLLFLHFKGDHVAFRPNAIGYYIRLHTGTPIVVCFDILLILCPLKVRKSNISKKLLQDELLKYENNNELLLKRLDLIVTSHHIVDESGVIPKK